MHLTASPADWYAARAGGVVAYVLLTVTVLLGLTMSSRRRSRRWPRLAIEDVHRFAGIVVGAFVVLHVAAVAIDAYLPFSPAAIVVPFVSAYRPLWVGLGIVAAELLLALAITNRLRHRALSYETWRRIHRLNFAVWGGATLHGLGAGTDRSTPWMVALYACGSAAVVAFAAFRVLRRRALAPGVRAAAPPGLAALVAAGVLVLALGPLRPHVRPWNAAAFTDELDGTIQQRLGATRGIVSMAGRGLGDQRVLVRADLLVSPRRLLDTAFQMEYLPSGDRCRGRVTRVDRDGLGFAARCRLPDGGSRRVTARWVSAGGAAISGGTISSRPDRVVPSRA